ncbi:MAG TPA: transporter substrate-binding domain-containing protein [Caldisericia bacterium]|nr:transporter substrate-binding domain-containing protein [Caldisericia bacterium]
MRRFFLIYLVLILVSLSFFGCNGNSTFLTGIVKNEDNQPLKDVTIYLDGRTSKTDDNGKFEFRNLETKKYKLSVNLEGFYPYETEVDISQGENKLNVSLKYTTLTKARKRGYLLVGSDVTYPPFEYMENGKPIGFDVDLINLVAKEMGLERAEVMDTAWDGIFAALKTEKFDIIISSVTITDERKKEILFSDPYYNSGQIIAIRKDDNRIKNENDLKGMVVGVQINTTGDFSAQEIPGIKEIKRYDDIQQAFQDLEIGRIDAILNDLPVNAYFASTRPNIKLVGTLLTEEQYGICARLVDSDLITEINSALRKIRDSGKYREIYLKWFGVEPID